MKRVTIFILASGSALIANAESEPTKLMCDGVYASEDTDREEIPVNRFSVIVRDGSIEVGGVPFFGGSYQISSAFDDRYVIDRSDAAGDRPVRSTGSLNRLDGSFSMIALDDSRNVWTHRIETTCVPMKQLF